MEITGRSSRIKKLQEKAASLKKEAYALYLAARDPRVPWYAKAFLGLVLAYTFSPIDLIPDFIPVIGYLDDLIIVPLGIVLALRMIPPQVMSEARNRVDELVQQGKPVIRGGVIIMIVIWLAVIAAMVIFILN